MPDPIVSEKLEALRVEIVEHLVDRALRESDRIQQGFHLFELGTNVIRLLTKVVDVPVPVGIESYRTYMYVYVGSSMLA